MNADTDFKEQLKAGHDTFKKMSEIDYHHYPRSLILQIDKVKLYHYASQQKKSIHRVPLLVVFSTVNRPEILELNADNSFIGGLLAKGLDVYLLDWGYPDSSECALGVSDYVHRYLDRCAEKICQRSEVPQINLLGICQGGVLSLCYAAQAERVNRLVLISTPVDFHTTDNVLTKIVRNLDVSALAQAVGNVPGVWLSQFFISLRPFELMGKKYLRLVDRLSDQQWVERFMRVEKWLYDAPDQPAVAFAEFVRACYQNNALIKNQWKIGGKPVDLKNLNVPVLNIMANSDELVPASASLALKNIIRPSLYSQKIVAGGHIGIYLNTDALQAMTTRIANWLNKNN